MRHVRTHDAARGAGYHTIVIGAGPGGMTVAIGLARFGRRVALVEARQVGGDCTNVGCVPSKALLHASVGVEAGSMEPGAVMRQVRDLRDHVRAEDARQLAEAGTLDLITGRARVAAPRTVEVTDAVGSTRLLRARHVVVATGSSPVHLALRGLPAERMLTNETVFELEALPRTLAIIGGGAIGAEMALAFVRLGSRVTLIEAGERLLSRFEPEAGELVARRLASRGVRVLTRARATRYEEADRSLVLADDRRVEDVEAVLVAIGRRPNTRNLGLEALGVPVERGALVADTWGRTAVPWLHAVGDVTGSQATTAAANAVGRRLVRRLALPGIPTIARAPVLPGAVYTEPEVASAGPTLANLRERYPDALIATHRVSLAELDRAKTDGVEDGFLLVHALRLTGRILSATWLGPQAADMLPILTLAIQKRMSLVAFAGLVFPYPSLGEAVKRVGDEFFFDTLAHPRRELRSYLVHRLRSSSPRHVPTVHGDGRDRSRLQRASGAHPEAGRVGPE